MGDPIRRKQGLTRFGLMRFQPQSGKQIRMNVVRSQNRPTTKNRYAKPGGNVLEKNQYIAEGQTAKKGSRTAKLLKQDKDRNPNAFRKAGFSVNYQGDVKYPSRIYTKKEQKLGN